MAGPYSWQCLRTNGSNTSKYLSPQRPSDSTQLNVQKMSTTSLRPASKQPAPRQDWKRYPSCEEISRFSYAILCRNEGDKRLGSPLPQLPGFKFTGVGGIATQGCRLSVQTSFEQLVRGKIAAVKDTLQTPVTMPLSSSNN